MNQVRALSLLSLGRAELVGRGADLADAVEPCSRRPHGDGAPPRVDRQSGREDVLLPRARRAAHAVDALREPLYVAEPFQPRERVPLDAEHLRLRRREEPPFGKRRYRWWLVWPRLVSCLHCSKYCNNASKYTQFARRNLAAFEVADTAKTDSAYLYSCLLTRANAIEKGLNPPCSFNSVSALRNRPPGDPNCALFPQGPIFPYRPVGACGIIGPFPQVGMQKGSLRTRKFGGRCSHYFAGGLALWRRRNSIRRYSAAPKCELRSQFPLFPLND